MAKRQGRKRCRNNGHTATAGKQRQYIRELAGFMAKIGWEAGLQAQGSSAVKVVGLLVARKTHEVLARSQLQSQRLPACGQLVAHGQDQTEWVVDGCDRFRRRAAVAGREAQINLVVAQACNCCEVIIWRVSTLATRLESGTRCSRPGKTEWVVEGTSPSRKVARWPDCR